MIFHSPAPTSERAQSLLLVYIRRVVGEVTYEVCEHCASGVITQVDVATPLQDSGLGTRAVAHLRACYPDVTWRSCLAQRMTRDLAPRMRLPNDGAGLSCPHLTRGGSERRGGPGRARR
ncbi:N-acetyltransferase [Streptomyces sioyaensis]|uniref:N-acetyltransferase n=1 Tax=Streptomyces sioyaensis TaxID=67364 RepID=UPI0037B2A9B1